MTIDSRPSNLLLDAAAFDNIGTVRLLLLISGENLSAQDVSDDTPLLLVAREGYAGIIKPLIKVPWLQINAQDVDIRTALSFLSEKGHFQAVGLLFDRARQFTW